LSLSDELSETVCVAELTGGAITFLFTDVEGSTRLLKQLRDRYGDVLAEHQRLLREAFDRHAGRVVDTQGDSFFVAFGRARDALSAAIEAQRALADHDWPAGADVRVRMGIHTGQAAATEETYLGLAVHRAARISASGHGGQILVSQTTHNLLEDEEEEIPGVELSDLGEQWLKDLDRPVHLYQAAGEGLEREFPPLRTEAPVPAAAPERHPRRRGAILVGALAGVIAAAVAIPIFALGGGSGGGGGAGGVEGNGVGLIDAKTGDVKGGVPLLGPPTAVATGLGSVWAASTDADAVYEIDPHTKTRSDTIQVESAPAGIAVGGGYVWVTNSLSSTVSQINPQGGVPEEIRVGNGPTGIAFDKRGYVWVANTLDDTISRIRVRDGKVGTFLHAEVPPDPGAVAVGAGALWVASRTSPTIVKLDPASGQRQLDPIPVGQVPAAILVARGSVWVANSADGTVSQIDPADGRLEAVIPVGAGPSGLALVGDEVWTANELAGTVSRIDPASGRATPAPLGSHNRPTAIAAGDGIVYVALRPAGAAHQGGTLKVAADGEIPLTGVDVAVVSFSALREFVRLTNDALVTYRHVGGQAGYQLVPDLALRMPTISEDRKTYTFQLRPDVRYSDGTPVRAGDFRHSIERGYMLQARADPAATFSGILGAERCGPRHCNLAAGIKTDDAARTVTFHLSAPNPHFLFDLADGQIVPGYVVPGGTPVREAKRRPLPATGPYRIKSFSQRSVRLVRNPYFHEWFKAAQPAGFPDEIVLKAVGPPLAGDPADAARRQKGGRDRVALVQQQKADITSSAAIPVDARFRPWVKSDPLAVTSYFSLATDRPPFDDRRARQAVNYALDRNRVVHLVADEDTARPTCQVLPPNFPGYRPYCPYTLHRSTEGRWAAPDPAKAKRLVAASGTAGTHVRLWVPSAHRNLGRYVKGVLEDLEYRVTLRSSFQPSKRFGKEYEDAKGDPFRRYFIRLGRGAMSEPEGPQIAWGGWVADYPAASDFIEPLFSCASAANSGRICDRALERKIKRAARLEQDDPLRANRLWADLDHEITNEALWVPLHNTYASDLVSKRVGNYQFNPQLGVLLSQIWVR
jgi:ABC-type transport system substrate-binding protein/class 3 adenylate cyclase/sugar lactone lactonase YvrE